MKGLDKALESMDLQKVLAELLCTSFFVLRPPSTIKH